MKRLVVLMGTLVLLSSSIVLGQDAMQYGLKHLKVLAEDEKVRVLKYTPEKGDKTPMHSHPSTVVYVIKGGRVRFTKNDQDAPPLAVGRNGRSWGGLDAHAKMKGRIE